MKPLYLEIEGFGPYLEKTTIDFTQFNQNLTLITGNTGSGKTTIFDAICCALFGETSGKSRSFKQMRSEFADDSDKTEITFKFELNGIEYEITRSPAYLRKKKNSDDYTEVPPKAFLKYKDRLVEKTNNVNREIDQIFNIGKDEFREIVMIAQNDFMAMLTATNKQQEEIFNRIFDANLYKNFNNSIRKRKNETKSAIENLLSLFNHAITSKKLDVDSEIINLEYVNLEQLLDILNKKLSEANKELKDLELKKFQKEEEYSKVNRLIKETEDIKKDILQRNDIKEKLQNLEKKKNYINELIQKVEKAKRARDIVEKSYLTLERINSELDEKETNLKLKENQKEDIKIKQKQQKEILSQYSNEELIKLKNEYEEYKSSLSVYKEITLLKKKVNEIKIKLESQNSERETKKQKVNEIQKELKNIQIESKDIFLDKRKLLDLEESNNLEKINILKDALNELNTYSKDLEHYKDDHKEIKKLSQEYKSEKDEYDSLFNNYINNQAALLAQNLQKDKPCPVCGSLEHPHPAIYKGVPITSEELEEKKITEEKAFDTFNTFLKEIEMKKNALCFYLRSLMELSEKVKFLFPGNNSEIIENLRELYKTYRNYLNNINSDSDKNKFKEIKSKTKKIFLGLLDQLKSSNKRIEGLKRDLLIQKENNDKNINLKESLDKQLETLSLEIPVLDNSINSFNKNYIELNSKIQFLEDNFAMNIEIDLEDMLKESLTNLKNYEKAFEKAKKDLETINSKYQMIFGEISSLESSIISLKKNRERAALELEERLIEGKFTNTREYLKSALSLDELSRNEKLIANYNNELLKLSEQFKIVDQRITSEEEIRDLDELLKLSNTINEDLNHLENAIINSSIYKNDINETIGIIQNNSKEYVKEFEKYQIYSNIDSLVNKRGQNFAQFVLSIYFREVLNKANQKLQVMTDGQFELRQPREGSIEISIFDALTGKERDIKTLSGGETFITSLSLALGFSEVVEEKQGGVRLDTIFIDEGFGSLDAEYLDKAIEVLDRLSNDRKVAIISHVELLKERIPQQIIVDKNNNGSFLKIKK